MMRLLTFLFILQITALDSIWGQGRDNYWPIGYSSYTTDSLLGGMEFQFPNNTAVLDTHSRKMSFRYTNAAICNDTGALQFYTNGVYIANALNDTMMNGSGLNPSAYTTQFANSGLRLPQAALILPEPSGGDSIYSLFHWTQDIPNPFYASLHLYKSIINMKGDSSRGNVISKNIQIINDTLYPTALTAVKHGNGRDWWMLVPRWGTKIWVIIHY